MKKAHSELYEQLGRAIASNQLFPPSTEETHNLIGDTLDATQQDRKDRVVRGDQVSMFHFSAK